MSDEPTSLLRLHDVLRRTGVGRTTLLKLVAQGRFPASFRIEGTRIAVWDSQAIDRWIHDQLNRAHSAD